MGYKLHPLAVLFHPQLDEVNLYTTLVTNPESGEYFVTTSQEYKLLKTIDQKPAITKEELYKLLVPSLFSLSLLNDRLDFFIKENVICNT